ncbi:hypothetical protein ACFHWW_27405 [Ensifer sp. P24N7]|uniref:hypothetical protein n=1 Tax=Sinorhizobium sp. P24N7 TaxID=3348358 RepID=UPI0035F3C403
MPINSEVLARISALCDEVSAAAEGLHARLIAQPDDKMEQVLGDHLAALAKLEAVRDTAIENAAKSQTDRSDLFAGGKDV